MSGKRKRSDSTAAIVEAAQTARAKIDPPSYLSVPDEILDIWNDIIATRAISSWTPNDLIQAVTLARIYYDINKYSQLVSKATRFSKDADGNYKVHAAHKILVDLVAQAQSLSRSLQVHARATQGESRDQVKRNELYQSVRNSTNIGDDLLAKPRH